MTYIVKPKFHHPALPKNSLGYTHRDYEGSVSTLCAGCGHDSISAAIIEACFELALPPHRGHRQRRGMGVLVGQLLLGGGIVFPAEVGVEHVRVCPHDLGTV